MQTRITYRQHKVAQSVLQELIRAPQQGRWGSATIPDPLLAFAKMFLSEVPPPDGSISHGLHKSREILTATILRAVAASPPEKPSWAAKAEAVLHLSERLLGMVPPRSSSDLQDKRTAVHRRRSTACGTYSTPDFVADEMCRDLIQQLKSDRRSGVDIADLSLEGGNFPLSLIAQQPSPTIRFHGIDRDGAALKLARLLVGFAQRAGQIRNFKLSTAQRDSILQNPPKQWPRQFDAVVGNPPWKTRHATDTRSLQDQFKSILAGQFDVYLAFMLKAHNLLKPGGLLTMVVPSAFLFNHNALYVRNLLLQQYDILRLRIYPRRSFVELPCVIPISFLARKRARLYAPLRPTTISYSRSSFGGPYRPRLTRNLVVTTLWRQIPNTPFHPLASRDMLFLAKLSNESTLKDHGILALGAQFGRQNAAASPVGFLGVNGRDLRPFHCCTRNAKYYIDGKKLFAREPPFEHISKWKVILQKTRCMTLPQRLVAALGSPGQLPASAALMFVPHDQSKATFFEALLNSQFANAWLKLREVNRSISLKILENLPVAVDFKMWEELSQLARQMESSRRLIHERVESCMIREEHRVYSERFPLRWDTMLAVKAELDRQLFELYDLTAKQRIVTQRLSEARTF